MKCSKCNQEIVDNKEFCPNCGTKLKEYETVFNGKKIIIIMLILILLSTGGVFIIMFGGVDKELEPYLNKEEEEKEKEIPEEQQEISEYFGTYYISDVKSTEDTDENLKEIMNDFVGWNIDFYTDKIKLPLYKSKYVFINNPSVFIDKTENFKDLFEGEITNVLIQGENSLSVNEEKNEVLNFIISDNKVYLYYSNILFELNKSQDSYKNNNNFYNINLVSGSYTKEIEEEITLINNDIKSTVESSGNYIILVDYKVTDDGNIKHIFVEKFVGVPNGHAYNNFYNITYNSNTLKRYNVEEYLSYKGYNVETIKQQFNNEKDRLYNEQQDFIDKVVEYDKDIFYYVSQNTLYMKYAEGEWGDMFVEINL